MLAFKLYCIITFITSLYAFYSLYCLENQLFGFTLHIVNSKIYFCIAFNFIVMLTVLTGKLLIKLFFGEVRLSELSEVSEKIRAKFFHIFLWFLSFRPTIDISKIILIVLYFFMAILTYITFKRSSYMVSLNEKSKKAQAKIIFIFVFLGILNYTFYYTFNIIFDDTSVTNKNEILDSLIYYIFSNEFILLFIKLIAKFYKFTISITSINMGKVWEHRIISFRIISLVNYMIKIFFEVKCCYLMFSFGVIYLYYVFDWLYSIWHLFKLFLKIYEHYRITNYIKNLRDYDFAFELNKLGINDELSDEIKEKFKSEKAIICNICLSHIDTGKYLTCGHVFHLKCIKEWSIVNVNCPIDKSPLINEESTRSKFLANQLGHQNNENHGHEITDEEILEKINLIKVSKGIYIPKKNADLTKYSFYLKMKNMSERLQVFASETPKIIPGAITYSLPCEAVYNRGLENEIKRLEYEILNKQIVDLYKNPYNAMNKYDDILNEIKQKNH